MTATRQEVYSAIDSERSYQDRLWNSLDTIEPMTAAKTLNLLSIYVRKAQDTWVGETGYNETAHMLRKIAGIAVAGMEHTGAPAREVQPTL